MKICSTLIVILFATNVFSQTFNKRYGVNSDIGYTINCRGSAVSDNGIYMMLSELTANGWKPRVYRTNMVGDLSNVWEYEFEEGVLNIGWADDIHSITDSTLLLSGVFTTFSDSMYYGCIANIDTAGNLLWHKTYGDAEHIHFFQQAKPTSDGGYIAVGSAELTENLPKFYVVKTDSFGNEEWHAYLGIGNKYRQGVWVNELLDHSGYVVSGYEDDTEYDPVALVFVLDTLGNITDWKKYSDWGYYDSQSAEAILPCVSGGFAFTTAFNVEQVGILDYTRFPQLVRVDGGLDTIWTCQLMEVNSQSSAQVIYETPHGDFVTVGTLIDGAGTGAGHINKVNSGGELLWHRTYRYAEFGDNLLFDIDPMPNGGYVCTGWMNGIPALGDSIPDQDAWLLAVDSLGCLVPGCDTLNNTISEINPVEFLVYPNPADQFINIAFSKLETLGQATLRLYDMQGRVVKSTSIKDSQATYIFDGTTLENGIYVLTIDVEQFSTSKKIVIQH